MSFLAPLAFLGALIAIPIILLYMLRLRRQEHVISSTFLWQQVIQDTEANSPWQRLRRNLLLFLQLLILAAMVLALARPFITVPTVSSGKIALLMDASASMNASDIDGRTRFSAAIDKAMEIVGNMNPQDSISIIRVGEVAEPITSYTSDVSELRSALNSIAPSHGRGDWDTALTLAAAGSAGAKNFSIVIISDGGMGSASNLPANIPQPIYVPVGESADNVAITALATRALPGENPQLFAQVTNYSDEAADISLVVRLDGVLRLSRSGTIPARSQLPIPFTEPIEQEFETLEATLTFDNPVTDYLDIDNTAWTVQSETNTRRILFISDGSNLFLEQVLRSLPGVQTFRGDPNSTRLSNADYDLYIFNQWLPDVLPDGDMLIINPPRSTNLFTLGEESGETGNITIDAPEHGITAFVDLDEMSLLKFRDIRTTWGETLISADGGALLIAGEPDSHQVAILTFDIRNSNLPLLIAYPVLMANLADWFSPTDVISVTDGLSVGDPVILRPPTGADLVRITAPDGIISDLPVDNNTLVFTATNSLGLYQLDILQDEEVVHAQHFAVNLFTTGESDITPVPEGELEVGGSLIENNEDEQLGLREFWSLIALLAIILLAIEWYVYHRRLQVPTILTPIQRRRAARANSPV